MMKVLVVIMALALAILVSFYILPELDPQERRSEPVDFNPFTKEFSI